jgi:DNA-binding transcriptional MerR regulator
MKISEVSEQYDISADTLRYYERVGLIPAVNRTESGIRDYNPTDVEWVDFIKCMRNAGLPIEVLSEYVELVQQGEHTNGARKQILINQRDELVRKMEEMQKTLDLLNYKIKVYENAVLEKEKDLSID